MVAHTSNFHEDIPTEHQEGGGNFNNHIRSNVVVLFLAHSVHQYMINMGDPIVSRLAPLQLVMQEVWCEADTEDLFKAIGIRI